MFRRAKTADLQIQSEDRSPDCLWSTLYGTTIVLVHLWELKIEEKLQLEQAKATKLTSIGIT